MIDYNTVTLVSKQFKENVEKKYKHVEMKLFGSSARGDQTKGSDIDIMISLPQVNRDIEEDLFDIAYDLELEYDCVIDVIVIPQNIKNNIPIYHHIKKEGIPI